jgi:hypothetical protein
MDNIEISQYVVLHAQHGDTKCDGLITPQVKGDDADFICGKCGATVRTVEAADVEQELADMASVPGMLKVPCPSCGGKRDRPNISAELMQYCPVCNKAFVT